MKRLIYLMLLLSLLLVGCNVSYIYPTTTITKYTELQDFTSLEDLRVWLAGQTIPANPDWNCVDYALDLRDKAEEDGYRISDFSSENYFYNWFFKRFQLADGTHTYNRTQIGDWVYYIEPQNHEVSRRAENYGD